MTTSRSLLVVTLALFTACGDDGVRHLPDAPWSDAPSDAPLDSPGADDVALVIMLAGNGAGTISTSPAGIICGATCSADFARNTVVTLTAVADTGSVFGGWSGSCSGTLPTCEITLASAANATATFTLATYTVTISKSGAGSGTISGDGISCGVTCTTTVNHGTALSLSATPASLSTFAGWGGACSGTGACALTVTAPTTISASFVLDDVTLFVTRGGTGTGTVTSAPAGISCGTDCDQTYIAGQMTTLTAVPATGSMFTGWTGATCSGTAPCTLTMTAAVTVTATFTLNTYLLSVARTGTGSGSVTSAPAGIACGADCSNMYNHGTMVTLTPTASTGSTFTGWMGACTGNGACVVPMTAARSVTATFTLDTHTLSVGRNGTGAGTVTATGISCGATCSAPFDYGTVVTVSATPSTGSTFAGWSGACSGTGACIVTMDMARSVTATFTLNTYPLTVTTGGSGAGTVTGTGISCGADCMETLGHGTSVTLTATPTSTSFFAGWNGACSGTGSCVVTMDAAKSVTATFTINSYLLSVTTSGSGTVSGTGISCGVDCSESFTHGATVTLSASAATGSTFAGWGGSCSGTGACVVTMTAARSVTATFTLDTHTLTVSRNGTGQGSVSGAGIACGIDCMETVGYGTTITLIATASSANATRSTFIGWSGACSGTGSCTVTMTAAASVTATFELAPNYIFVTSGTFTGSLGQLAGADSQCQQHAAAGNLPGTYRAYLSSIDGNTPTHAPSRMNGASGWIRFDGAPVMNSITQLAGGTLFNPVQLTESGLDIALTQVAGAWTGTSPSGTYAGACFSDASGLPWDGEASSANIGDATSTSNAVAATAPDCTGAFRLYCLGVDRAAIAQ